MDFHELILQANPHICESVRQSIVTNSSLRPDGDADIENVDFRDVIIPNCEECGVGIMKSTGKFYFILFYFILGVSVNSVMMFFAVVFFGGSVGADVVDQCLDIISEVKFAVLFTLYIESIISI